MTDRTTVATELPEDALSIAPDQVAFIVAKAREFSAKVGGTQLNDASNPADEQQDASDAGSHLILENMREDPVLREYEDAITGLGEDEQRDLVALAWIGRGEYEAEDWTEARRHAGGADLGNSVAHYLVRDPLTGDEIAEGMSRLGYDLADYGAAEHL